MDRWSSVRRSSYLPARIGIAGTYVLIGRRAGCIANSLIPPRSDSLAEQRGDDPREPKTRSRWNGRLAGCRNRIRNRVQDSNDRRAPQRSSEVAKLLVGLSKLPSRFLESQAR